MKNKKVIIIGLLIVIVGVVLYLVLKDNNNNLNEFDTKAQEILNGSDKAKDDVKNGKILVVYFSMAGEVYNVGDVTIGNTAIMASYIVDYLKADSYEIVPVKNYPTKYNDLIEVAKEEQRKNERPEIKNKINNLDSYDTIFIGYPIWWGDLPPIVYTFLEQNDFTNKIIIPFNTHEGSGSSGTHNTIKNKLTKANVNTNGLALQGKVARITEGKEKTINWLKGLGY